MKDTIEGTRVHVKRLGERVRMAFKPKRGGWARLELDFKNSKAQWPSGLVSKTEARKWVYSLARRRLDRDAGII